MGIEAAQIEVLKERLLNDTDLAQFWNYYFTNFAEHPTFKSMGAQCRNEAIERLLHLIGQKLTGRDSLAVDDLVLIEIPGFQLIHGSCYLQGRLACLLYFPEIKAGVISVVMSPGGKMIYARITAAALESLKSASNKIQ